jgi:hypothetical protein
MTRPRGRLRLEGRVPAEPRDRVVIAHPVRQSAHILSPNAGIPNVSESFGSLTGPRLLASLTGISGE